MMTPQDAALFVMFQEHYHKISFMIAQGAFEVRHGSVIVNFDKDGNISSLERRLFSYPKKVVV